MASTILRKYTDKECERYWEEYQNSDLTVSGFTKEKGIPASTLKGWLNKEVDIKFGEIQTEDSNNRTTMPRPNKVFITENIRIELKYGYNKDFLKQVSWLLSGLSIEQKTSFKEINLKLENAAS